MRRRRSCEKREEEEEEKEKDGSERLRRSGRLWWEDVLVRGREKPYGSQKCQVMRSTFLLVSYEYPFLLFPPLVKFFLLPGNPRFDQAGKELLRGNTSTFKLLTKYVFYNCCKCCIFFYCSFCSCGCFFPPSSL